MTTSKKVQIITTLLYALGTLTIVTTAYLFIPMLDVIGRGALYTGLFRTFISAGIVIWLAYALPRSRSKITYWLAVVVVAVRLLRLVIAGGLYIWLGLKESMWDLPYDATAIMAFAAAGGLLIIPTFILLLQRDVREFLTSQQPAPAVIV